MSNSEEGRKLKRERDSIYFEQEKKRYTSSTFDLLPINSDTLIASTRYNGIIFSTNAGSTWTPISNPGIISKLTIDNNKTVWGLYSWQGIHEADRSVLYSSADYGKTWDEYDLDTKEIFPGDFYSKPKERLRVIDFDSRIYELIEQEDGLKWTLVDSLKEKSDIDPWIGKGFVIDSKKRRWTFNHYGIFLIERDTIKVY